MSKRMQVFTFASLLCIWLMLWIGVLGYAQEQCQENPQVARLVGPVVGTVAGEVNPCGCPTSTYLFCYTGDYNGDTDKACFSNGSTVKDGDSGVSAIVSSSYIEFPAAGIAGLAYVAWSMTGNDGFNYSEGTLFVSFWVNGTTDWNDNTIVQFCYDDVEEQNLLVIQTNDSGNNITAYWEGASTSANIAGAGSYTEETWYRVGYTWQTGAGGGGKHSISVVALGSDPAWTEEVEDLDDWANNPSHVAIGYKFSIVIPSCAIDDTLRVSDLIVLSGYQTDDPRQ